MDHFALFLLASLIVGASKGGLTTAGALAVPLLSIWVDPLVAARQERQEDDHHRDDEVRLCLGGHTRDQDEPGLCRSRLLEEEEDVRPLVRSRTVAMPDAWRPEPGRR